MDNDMQPVVTRREGDGWATDSYTNPARDGVTVEVRTVATDKLRHLDAFIFTHDSEHVSMDIHNLGREDGARFVTVLLSGVGRGHNTISARVFLSEAQARKLVSLLHRELDRKEAPDEG